MLNASNVEHSLTIHNQRYHVVGALLRNNSHYRSLALIGGKYLMYDGLFSLNKTKWIRDDEIFGQGMYICKMWYVKTPTENDSPAQLCQPIVFGYETGISIEPTTRNTSYSSGKCYECGAIIDKRPCVTVREDSNDSNPAQVRHYCISSKCCGRFRQRANEISKAIEESSYSGKAKDEIRKKLEGIVSAADLTKDSSDDGKSEVVSVKDLAKDSSDSGSDDHNGSEVAALLALGKDVAKDDKDVDESATVKKKEALIIARYDEGQHVCKNFPDLDEKKQEIPGKSTWYRGKVERELMVDGLVIRPYLIRYDDDDVEEMYEKALKDVIVKLRVGDRIEYRGYNELQNTTATIVEIAVPYYENDEYYDITTTAQWSDISANRGSGRFRIVESVHPDAPPTGVWTTLEDVNMILGRLDDSDEAARADREKNNNEFLRTNPEAMAAAALAVGIESANKRLREEIDSDNDDDSSKEDEMKTNNDNDSEEESDSESGEESGENND